MKKYKVILSDETVTKGVRSIAIYKRNFIFPLCFEYEEKGSVCFYKDGENKLYCCEYFDKKSDAVYEFNLLLRDNGIDANLELME